MLTPRLFALIVAISLVGAVGDPLAAIAQETAADNDSLQEKTGSLHTVPNNEQSSNINQTDVPPESNDPVDVFTSRLELLRAVAPDLDIRNSTTSEIDDLLEFYGLDTDGPVCPPCS